MLPDALAPRLSTTWLGVSARPSPPASTLFPASAGVCQRRPYPNQGGNTMIMTHKWLDDERGRSDA